MRGVVLHAPGDIRVEHRNDPAIIEPTDAIIRISATCVCGSDLWDYRGIHPVSEPMPIGHEYCGIVEEIGAEVTTIRPGQFVIGSFVASDNTCPHCLAGYQSACQHRKYVGADGAQAEALRVPLADGTLVATPGVPEDELLPGLLTASDVLGTGWFAAVAAGVRPRSVAVVVGDGAVGLLGVLAARELGAERIIVMSRNASRQKLAQAFGATDIVAERGEDGIAQVMDLTGGVGADAVLECVGTGESFQQALRSARPGGGVGIVGLPHDVSVRGQELFSSQVRIQGGPAPVRRFLPELIDLIWQRKIDPGPVFDLALPLEKAADGYAAMDSRRAVKAILHP
ncbi:zinc-dependent alcohol dehydrogenase family protein [Nocardia sp. CA-135953]|uniref:zinc-dependent alcohol dehydrogenase family protein n=1 Tax=Nocardia sp. CA-135953 TaxID=3239978 RepID=UPI003D972212